jgi:hypothetical protein
MTSALDKYAAGESKTIKGWLSRIDAEILRSILTTQNMSGLTGSVAEIGVHHGRGFVRAIGRTGCGGEYLGCD